MKDIQRFFFGSGLILIFLLLINSDITGSQSICSNVSCLYLPFMNSTPPIYITNINTLHAISGDLRVVGEVLTAMENPIFDVTIEVQVYDQFNQVIGTQTGSTVFTVTLPGQLNVFDIETDIPDNGQISRTEVEITDWNLDVPENYVVATVALTDTTVEFGYGTHVYAEIRNDTGFSIRNVVASTWSLDQAYSIYSILVSDILSPGEVASFETFLYGVYDFSFQAPIRVVAQGIIESKNNEKINAFFP